MSLFRANDRTSILHRFVIITLAIIFAAAFLFSFLMPFTGTDAQDNGIITPTPAPSKTPSAEEATVEATSEATTEARTPSTGPIQSLTQSDLSILTGNVQRPNGITWFDDELYVSCSGDWTIYQINAASGQTLTYIYGIRNAHSLHAERGDDEELHLWVPDFQTNTLNDVTRNGVRAVTNALSGPWGLVQEDDETFLITNLSGNTLTRVGRDGEVDTVVGGLRAPTGVEVDESLVYVANNGSTRRAIEWYDLTATEAIDSSELAEEHSLVTGLQNVTGLSLGPDGYLYFAFSLGTRGVVGRVDPERCRENGGCTHEDVEIVLLTELAAPLAGLTIAPDGRLFVHTMFSPDIYWAYLPGFEPEA